MFDVKSVSLEWGGKTLTLETGRIARQADGAVLATYGETVVLCAVTAAKSVKEGQDFFPLTVHYQEKFFAAGRIPGGFFKRERGATEKETLVSRLIDRPVRPLFPEGFYNEINVIAQVLSYDGETEPDVLAMIAASAALTISGTNPPGTTNTTSYPVDLSMGSTWNPDLVHQEAAQIGDEAREVVPNNTQNLDFYSPTVNLGRGAGLAESAALTATPGVPISLGAWTLTLTESTHCPPDRFPGVIQTPVRPPARVSAWRCGEAWSAHLRHDSGATVLVQGSAGYVTGAVDGTAADVVYLGVGQLGIQPDSYLRAYWEHVVRACGARTVVLTHWDDFFVPADRPLRANAYAVDDLDHTVAVLAGLAETDGVRLAMPTIWSRQDPWTR